MVINPDYTITYMPAIDFNGVDSFMYTLSDGKGGTEGVTRTVTWHHQSVYIYCSNLGGQPLLDAAEDLRTSLTVTAEEAAVDVALADDDLLADVLPSAASAAPAGRRR